MKKFINHPDTVIADALAGMAAAHSDLLRVQTAPKLIVRTDAPVAGKVGIVSGGGSGHEPLHGGYVGLGMLDAACPGEVFTSPTPDQMLAAAQAVDGGAGVLFIVKNYTGDVMNFEMAAELAQMEGLRVATVLLDDDVAVKDSTYTAGRRGVGGTVLAEKICGAAAQAGYDLDAVAALGRRVSAQVRSMGVALTSCTVPAAGQPTFTLGEDEMEIGIGIHGEPGRQRTTLKSADDITALMAEAVLNDLPFAAGDEAIVLVNGMGGTPLLELYILYQALARLCAARDVRIVRNLVGNYITSLEMAGASITMLKVDAEMLTLWDAPVRTPALRWGV